MSTLTVLGIVPAGRRRRRHSPWSRPRPRRLLVKLVALLATSLVVLGDHGRACARQYEPAGGRFQFTEVHDWIPRLRGAPTPSGSTASPWCSSPWSRCSCPVVLLAGWYDADPPAVDEALAARQPAGCGGRPRSRRDVAQSRTAPVDAEGSGPQRSVARAPTAPEGAPTAPTSPPAPARSRCLRPDVAIRLTRPAAGAGRR